jgi:tryptophan synthase beta chain
MSREMGGAQIFLKREDLNHTGAHKINNTIGQAMLAKRMGKPRVIAETGAGQHGVATATICARYGLECVVYMGSEDVKRQSPNVYRMKLLGATVVPVESRQQDAEGRIERGHARLGCQCGQHLLHHRHRGRAPPLPDDGARFPKRDWQRVPGADARDAQGYSRLHIRAARRRHCLRGRRLQRHGHLSPLHPHEKTRLIGVEAAGEGADSGKHSMSIQRGSPGVLHGNRTYVLQDDNGQVTETHSISAGLDYPGVGPEHAFLSDIGRAEYVGITDKEALEAFHYLCRTEGHHPRAGIQPRRGLRHEAGQNHATRPEHSGQSVGTW